ncbi:MAG: hypothetical protein ACOY58_07810, partial [Candidatus Micrarchaeota archaeon]
MARAIGPDEIFSYGPLQIARYGRFVHLFNRSTPEEHAAHLKNQERVHKEVISELLEKIEKLQTLIQQYDPIEIMHRATYELLPLLLKYRSEHEFTTEESWVLPTLEYLQYLISRTPSANGASTPTEAQWQELWGVVKKVMRLTFDYLFTRNTRGTRPTEIEKLRFELDCRRLMIRVRRYSIYFSAHLRDELGPYEDAIKEAYGIDLPALIDGLEQVNSYQREGVTGRYHAFSVANEVIIEKLREYGFSVTYATWQQEDQGLREVLQTPALDALYRDLEEKARLTLTPAIFDITEITNLPQSLLSVLSIKPGESPLFTLTGPDHDDLSPLSPSPLHHKPFVESCGRIYYFYHSGFEDRIAEIVEADLFERFPRRAASLRRRRDDHVEALAIDLLVSVVKPDATCRNLYYPDPDQPGG